METYLRELSRDIRSESPPRLFFLKGDAGVGKSTFYSELWERISSQVRLATIWIRPKEFVPGATQADWVASFAQDITANRPDLTDAVATFQAAFAEVPRPQAPPANPGAAAAAPPPQEADASTTLDALTTEDTGTAAPMEPYAEAWVALFQHHVLRKIPAGDGTPSPYRIIFVLDRYHSLTPEKKRWFCLTLFRPLVNYQDPPLDVRFLLSGRQSFYQTLDAESYWPELKSQAIEIDLKPFTLEETAEFLKRSGLPDHLAPDLHKTCKGLPAGLEQAVAAIEKARATDDATRRVEGLLRDKNERQRDWLLQAAHLGTFDIDALSGFSNQDTAVEGYDWLRRQPDLKLRSTDTGCVMDAALSLAFLHWQELLNPEKYRTMAERALPAKALLSLMPDPRDRPILADLAVFNHFTPDAVRSVFGDRADALLKFVENHPEYFTQGERSTQVAAEYRKVLNAYHKLVPRPQDADLRKRIDAYWKNRREALLQEMTQIETTIQNEETMLETLRSQLLKVNDQIHSHEDILKRRYQKAAQKTRRGAPVIEHSGSRSMVASLLMEAAGIVLLYFGILFANTASVAYASAGIVLLILGLYWPYKRQQVAAQTNVSAEPQLPRLDAVMQSDQSLRLMNIQRSNIEHRRNAASNTITKSRKQLAELDALLHEPYV